ncbi:MAG TPA: tyrosine-protein phosphatase [Candidatus Lokiarchaeia archaeon]|nr:tyrosine-protein phosphatase [Candidatus Lokiarchaeia archaeon]
MDKSLVLERLSAWAGTVPFITACYHRPMIGDLVDDPGLELRFIAVLEPGHKPEDLPGFLKSFFGDELVLALAVPDSHWHNEIVAYFESMLDSSFPIINIRIDSGVLDAIEDASELIPVFVRSEETESQIGSSQGISTAKARLDYIRTEVARLVARYVRMEIKHFHSDLIGYLAEYFPLLTDTIRLQGIVTGKIGFGTSKDHLFNSVFNEGEAQFFTRVFLESARRLSDESRQGYIDWFSFILEEIQARNGEDALPAPVATINGFLARIHDKYYLRLFRPMQGTSMVYRALAPAEYKGDARLEKWFVDHDIKNIIDIRRPDEREKDPDDDALAQKLGQAINAISFNADEINANNYTKGLIGCENEIRQILEAILASPGGTLVHCVSGKDRTGIIAALVEMLLGVPEGIITEAYMLSGQDTRADRIEESMNFVNKHGGIQVYLGTCGFPEDLQARLIEKIKKRVD